MDKALQPPDFFVIAHKTPQHSFGLAASPRCISVLDEPETFWCDKGEDMDRMRGDPYLAIGDGPCQSIYELEECVGVEMVLGFVENDDCLVKARRLSMEPYSNP